MRSTCSISPTATSTSRTRSALRQEVAKHGGRVVSLGQFHDSITGDIEPRKVLVLVEWESREAFDGYCNDPELADLHAHRENGTSSYIWHLFDRLDDCGRSSSLRPVNNRACP